MVTAYHAFHCSSIGASHVKKGTVCQDDAASEEAGQYRLAVICDGHGGADYFRSDRGSRFAAQAFCACAAAAFNTSSAAPCAGVPGEARFLKNKARNFIDAVCACQTQRQVDEQILWFMRSVVTRWNTLVEQDIAADAFTEEEMQGVSDKAKSRYSKGERVQSAYGATLIGVILTDSFWFGIQIGDGKCVAFDANGTATEPIPWDDQCFLNVTTSICDSNAFHEFRHFFSRELPAAVFVGSDGIDDCFANEKRLHNFYRVVLSSFVTETQADAERQLREYLPELSAQGSGDDMSIGCILDIAQLQANPERFEKRKELYLKILRVGNYSEKSGSEDYTQKKEIMAAVGTVYLDTLGCAGNGEGIRSFEITAVAEKMVTIQADGATYVITPETGTEITSSQPQPNKDGFADILSIQCIMK